MTSRGRRPRICYVLSEDGDDEYTLMTQISATSVRQIHPDRELVLLCDTATASTVAARAPAVLALFDTVVTAHAEGNDAMQRSRWLKAMLRSLVDGELLYLDSDTVAVGPLDVQPADGEHVMAAYDAWDTTGVPTHDRPKWVSALAARLGWTLPVYYRNAGVVYFRDSPEAHAFGKRWYEEWRRGVATGSFRDQPSFNAVMAEFSAATGVLPITLNAMIRYRARMARGASLYHFWAETNPVFDEPDTLLDYLVAKLRTDGIVDLACIRRAGRRNYPWVRRQGVRIALEAGAYGVAARELLRKVVRSARYLERRYD